jgi:hypothetical protein
MPGQRRGDVAQCGPRIRNSDHWNTRSTTCFDDLATEIVGQYRGGSVANGVRDEARSMGSVTWQGRKEKTNVNR